MRVKYGTWMIISGLIAVILLFVVAMITFIVIPTIKPTASNVISAVSSAISEVGIIVGLYFGVQTGVAGKEIVDAGRAAATSRGVSLAAAHPSLADHIQSYWDAITKKPPIEWSWTLVGRLVCPAGIAAIVAPILQYLFGSSGWSPLGVASLTVAVGVLSTGAGVLSGVWSGHKVMESAVDAYKAGIKAVADLDAAITKARKVVLLDSLKSVPGFDKSTVNSVVSVSVSGKPVEAPYENVEVVDVSNFDVSNLKKLVHNHATFSGITR